MACCAPAIQAPSRRSAGPEAVSAEKPVSVSGRNSNSCPVPNPAGSRAPKTAASTSRARGPGGNPFGGEGSAIRHR